MMTREATYVTLLFRRRCSRPLLVAAMIWWQCRNIMAETLDAALTKVVLACQTPILQTYRSTPIWLGH